MFDESSIIRLLQDEKSRALAFTQVVEQYKERLYWQIRRMVINHEDTDDILQNVFIKAWTGLDNFRGESKLSTWLYRIATNETLNFLEREKKPHTSIDDEGNGIVHQLESDPYFDGDETQRQLIAAMDTLPDKQRQVFTLKYFDEMKYEEMSQVLGTSVGALKASYHHAVKKIADFFHSLD